MSLLLGREAFQSISLCIETARYLGWLKGRQNSLAILAQLGAHENEGHDAITRSSDQKYQSPG